MDPLRSYFVLLAPHTRSRNDQPVLHYVVEESPELAIRVCRHAFPDHRLGWIRDVTDEAAAA